MNLGDRFHDIELGELIVVNDNGHSCKSCVGNPIGSANCRRLPACSSRSFIRPEQLPEYIAEQLTA